MSGKKTKGFLRLDRWILEDLGGDYKAAGFYVILLKKVWVSKEPFIYKAGQTGRVYEVLAGEFITSYNRLKKEVKISHDLLHKILDKLQAIGAIKMTWLEFTNPNGSKGFDGVKIKCLDPIINPTAPTSFSKSRRFNNIPGGSEKSERHPGRNQIDTRSENALHNKNRIKLRKNELRQNKKENPPAQAHTPTLTPTQAQAHTPISTHLHNDLLYDSEGTKNIFDGSEEPKNIPSVAEKDQPGTLALIESKKPVKAKRKPRAKTIELSPKDIELGKWWYDETIERVSSPHKSWSPHSFAEILHKVRNKPSKPMSDENLEKVVKFCKQDNFWSRNCQSPSSLLKRNGDGVLRLDIILNQLITKSEMEAHRISKIDWSKEVESPFKGKLSTEPEIENPFKNRW